MTVIPPTNGSLSGQRFADFPGNVLAAMVATSIGGLRLKTDRREIMKAFKPGLRVDPTF